MVDAVLRRVEGVVEKHGLSHSLAAGTEPVLEAVGVPLRRLRAPVTGRPLHLTTCGARVVGHHVVRRGLGTGLQELDSRTEQLLLALFRESLDHNDNFRRASMDFCCSIETSTLAQASARWTAMRCWW